MIITDGKETAAYQGRFCQEVQKIDQKVQEVKIRRSGPISYSQKE
jgi:hypothetical protein